MTDDEHIERWFRRAGLPFFVRPEHRADSLLARISPFVVYLFALDLLLTALELVGELDLKVDDTGLALLVLAVAVLVALVVVALPVTIALLAVRLFDRLPRARIPVICVILGLFVFVMPWFGVLRILTGSPWWGILINAGLIGVALLLTVTGVGSLLGWSVVTAVRLLGALGQMTSIALPLLMLVVVFAFFARALWEVTSTMSWYRLEAVMAFFGILVLLFVIPATKREMRRLVETVDPDRRRSLLDRSGLDLIAQPRPDVALTRTERGNITVVLVLAQVFQVTIFAAVVCFFLIVLGQLAFSAAVLTNWLAGPPAFIVLFGFSLPFDVALLKTAVFLACVSSLNFAVSASTNASYRAAFYDPLFDEAEVALAVRDAYRAGISGAAR